MAFGGRQWAPYSSSSSSSTLSPLAPPFMVDRKPYDYAYDQAPDSDWRPLRCDLVQAEPFYPHYGSGVGRGGAPWNGPFDEGSGGMGKPSSSSPSPWVGRAEMGDSPWIGPVASAAPQQGIFSDGSPVENIWCSNHGGPYARKHFESDCHGWLKDKTSLHTKDSVLNSVHSSGSGFSPVELANDAFPYSSSHVASRVVRDTLNSSSHCYFGPTMQDGPWRDEEGVLCPVDVYCSPANISEKDPKAKKSPIGQVEKYALGRRHVSINIRVPSRKSDAEAVYTGAKSNRKGENIANANAGAVSLYLDKERPSAGHGIWSEESQEKLYAKSGLTNICSGASGSAEHGIPNKNSETIDQHSLAEDSPCWKGALTSRQSPFHSVNTFVANSLTVDKKIEDAVVEVLEDSDVIDSKLDSLSGRSERKKEVSYSDNIGSESQIEDCVDALLTKREISSSAAQCLSEDEIVSSKPLNKSAILKASCYSSSSHVYSSSWDSYPKGASHIVKPIGPPKSSHRNTSTKPLTGHFLFRTLYDLSAFCFSYSGGDVILTESDYELLLMTRYNIDACLSQRNIVGGKKECQHDPDQVEVLPKEGKNNSLCQVNNGRTPEIPEKMQPHHSGTCCVESGGLFLPTSGFNFTENDAMEDFENSLSTKFNVEVDNSEASLYKKLWIEAEAALCKMKYQLHSAQAKVEHQSVQEKDVQGIDMQDKSGSEVKPENKTSLPPITSKFVLDKENYLKSVQAEARSHNDLNIMAEASSPKREKVVASGVIDTKEEADPSVIARLRVLVARGNQVTSSSIDPQVKLHQSVAADPCVDLRQNSSKNSDDEFDVGACFQGSHVRPAIGVSPWVSNIGVAEARNVETATGSGDSRLIANFDRHVPLYEVDGHGGAARLHKGLSNRTVIESYVPNDMWQGNRFQDGKQGSSSSDWEHVLQEDLPW